MRPAVRPARWIDSERLLALQPDPADADSAGWQRRTLAFAGRSLSHLALGADQDERSVRLALRGQMLSPGVVGGFEVSFDRGTRTTLRIGAGTGIAASGEDVALVSELEVAPSELLVWGASDADGKPARLGDLTSRPRALVLALEPVEIHARDGGDLENPCENDPAADAFADHQRVDGALPIWVPLPQSLAAIAGDVLDPTMRNRLAHAIFAREVDAQRNDPEVRAGRKATFPWEDAGVALALVSFEDDGRIRFVDRHAVARRGGKARRRSALLLQASPYRLFGGAPALWQARIDQHADHTLDLIVEQQSQPRLRFAFAPPAGILPMDFVTALDKPERKQGFFPEHATIEWMPIPVEQLDAALAASAPLARFDLAKRLVVRMLVPVPQIVFESTLLVEEKPNEALLAERDRLGEVLKRARKGRDELVAEHDAVAKRRDGSKAQLWTPNDDGEQPIEGNPEVSAPGDEEVESFFTAAETFGVTKTHTRGVVGVREELARLADRADDAIDFGFLRVQKDIYRSRQILLGSDKASRLAVSSVLAPIVQGMTAQASTRELEATFERVARFTQQPKAAAPSAPAAATEPAVEEVVVVRSAAVGERLEVNPFIEARSESVTSKYGVLRTLEDIADLGVDDIQVMLPPKEPGGSPERGSFGSIRGKLEQYERYERATELDITALPDEARVLAGGARVLDDAVAVLRQIEARVARLRALVKRADELIVRLGKDLAAVTAKLGRAEKDLAEARHDYAVALALVEEDAARVAATNERRANVLREHVRFVAFVRPRTQDLARVVPWREAEAPEEMPVPACFLEDPGVVPDEIRQAVELVRRAPLVWLPPHLPLLDALDDRATLAKIATSAAQLQTVVTASAASVTALGGVRPILEGLGVALGAMEQQLGERDQAVAAFDAGRAVKLPWSELRVEAMRFVSLADFAHVGHLRPEILTRATWVLDGMTRVAACLYRRFAEVAPDVRLRWAEQVSVLDAAPNLRDLLALRGFASLPEADREGMQALVDWLYSQIAALPAPQAMMSNLVRVCVLLASHAPVRALLRGRIGPATVSIGHVVRIESLDVTKVRVGMSVLVGKTAAVRAVVKDVAETHAVAQIVATSVPSVVLPADTEVLLGDPAPIEAAAAQVLAAAAAAVR